MQNVKKVYRPKSGYEGAEVTFPNPLTGETVEISDWPHETESSVEMAHLDGHPWLREDGEPDPDKAPSKMTKAELLDYAEQSNHAVDESMTKAQILEVVTATDDPPPEETDDTGGSE